MHVEGISIVIPTLNETLNVKPLVREISLVMSSVSPSFSYELIFVDDGSQDGTAVEIKILQEVNQSIKLIENEQRLGLGASILVGMCNASFERVVVIDADLTHPVSEIPKMVHVSKEYDIVIGSRFCCGGGMENKSNYISSYLYNLVLRVLLRTQIQDSICGFFCVQKNKVSNLMNSDNFKGYGDYFFWFLKGAINNGLSIVEVPVSYRNRALGHSKSNRWRMLITYTMSALKCRAFYKSRV